MLLEKRQTNDVLVTLNETTEPHRPLVVSVAVHHPTYGTHYGWTSRRFATIERAEEQFSAFVSEYITGDRYLEVEAVLAGRASLLEI